MDGNYFIREGVSGDTLVSMDVVNFANQATHNFCVPNVSVDADFNGDDLTICAGESVSFTDASAGAITGWNWTFTGGTPASSTNQNPSNVVYSSAGTYAVSLQVTDGVTNNTETKMMYVSVTDNPSVSAVETSILCNGESSGEIDLTATGGQSSYNYLWSNGAIDSDITGLAQGTYMVTIQDANFCVVTASYNITQPPVLSAGIVGNDVTCGLLNGEATVSPSGGSGAYSYFWSSGGNTNTETGLSTGNVSVTIQDVNFCTATASVSIGVSPGPSLSTSVTHATCATSNGIGTAIIIGGNSPYVYTWSNGSNNQNATGLGAGSYGVTVVDGASCTVTSSANITISPNIVLSATFNNATCDINNGNASVSVVGGTQPYIYSWSNGANVSATNGLSANGYSVTVTDVNNCTGIETGIVAMEGSPTLSKSVWDETCGGSNGSISVTAIGGVTPYSYSWSSGGNAPNEIGLSSGKYSVTVTDGNNCTVTTSQNVSNNTPIAPVVAADATCGLNNGVVDVRPVGGLPPYNFNWSFGGTNQIETGLSPGVYTVTVTDDASCVVITSTTISAISAPVISTISNASTCGLANGSAGLNIAGGATPFLYNWSNGETTNTVTGLDAGTFNVTVSDDNACLVFATVAILNTAGPAITAVSTAEKCGQSDGTIVTAIVGGTAPFQYSWDSGETGAVLTGLESGVYLLTVTDDNNCVANIPVSVSDQSGPSVVLSSIDDICSASSGSATATVAGGTSPFVYAWSSGGITQEETGLASGAYSVTVIDFNGCLVSNSVVVENVQHTVTSSTIDANCGEDNGQIELDVSGGIMPYSYSWNTGNTNQILSNVGAGIYSVTVLDANACSVVFTEMLDSISRPQVIVSVQHAVCDQSNGSALALVNGGIQPYTYSWSGIVNGGDSLQENLEAGTYTVFVTDDLGCLVSSDVIVENYAAPSISLTTADASCEINNGTANAIVQGSFPFEYLWSTNEVTDSIANLAEGEYMVTVTDINNCEASDTAIVKRLDGICINPPSGFSPNGDGTNDVWNIDGAMYYPELSVEIYNRWGSLIYSSVGYTEPWSGLNRDGKELPAAVYYYVVKLGEEHRTGTVTIKR